LPILGTIQFEIMKYAVVRIQGHQYRVEEGQEILVDLLSDDPVVDTLLMVNDDEVVVGTPLVEKVKVVVKKLGDEKGEKIRVEKYKSKSRYRKTTGFRAKKTRLLVEKIA
jgi:large subunit ribosomal protein L21